MTTRFSNKGIKFIRKGPEKGSLYLANGYQKNSFLIGLLFGCSEMNFYKDPDTGFEQAAYVIRNEAKYQEYWDWKWAVLRAYVKPTMYQGVEGNFLEGESNLSKKFIYMYKDFYRREVDGVYRKRINKKLINRISRLGLAVWVMDSGWIDEGGLHISMLDFPRCDSELFIPYFKDYLHNIDMEVTAGGEILIGDLWGVEKFMLLVEEYILMVPCLYDKFKFYFERNDISAN